MEACMTLDEQLLKKAKSEGARFVAAEREATLARGDYHTAVRRLHLGGASLREVAQALGLSHQRVQQIVSGAGGTWWQRVWSSRNVKRDAVCTYCGRPPSETAKLIAGPNVYICDACVTLAVAVAARASRRSRPADSKAAGQPAMAQATGLAARCTFCGKRKRADRPLIASADANICGDCLRLCREILEGRSA
jgi:hypothetical protein